MSRTPKARALGNALRTARTERDVTLRTLSERISRDIGTLSRYENGERTPKPEHVAQILTALSIRGDQFEDIMALTHDTDAPLWVATTLPTQHQQLAAFVEAEQNAAHVMEVSPLLMPGLLQSNGYINAIMSGGGLPPDEIARRVAVRIGRRDILTRPKPVEFTAFVGEAALHQVIGGREIMIDQLRVLLGLIRKPHIHVHVVPFDSGWHPALEGAFTVIDPGKSSALVFIENRKSGLFVHEDDDLGAYFDAMDMVRTVAKDEHVSAALIAERLNGWEKV